MLQKGVADYELAQTFPAGSPERAKSLKEALAQFESLYKNYRTQLAGLAAQMWQAKCYEESGTRHQRGHRDLQGAHGARRPPAARPPAQRRLLLHRRPGQAQAVCPGGRRGLALARDVQSARRAAITRKAWASDRAGQEHRRPDAGGLRRRSAQGRQPDHRRRQAGRSLRLAVTRRTPRPAQEVQAERGREGRGDRQADLRRRHRPRPTTRSARRTGNARSPC